MMTDAGMSRIFAPDRLVLNDPDWIKRTMSASSSRNAVKHGLSSLRHMPCGREHELPPIEQELIESRQPETPEQLEIVKELAFAMWQKGEHERILLQEAAKLTEKAAELFDHDAEAAFETLKAKWLKEPEAHTDAMGNCMRGARHFAQIWRAIESSLKNSHGLTMQMAMSAIRAEGFSTSPLWIYGNGLWIMLHTLALKAKPEAFILEWMALEGLQESADAKCQCGIFYQNIPKMQNSVQDLYNRAFNQMESWTQKQNDFETEESAQRDRFVDQYCATASSEFEAQMQHLHRYRVFTENRVKELNRRLANNKAEEAKKKRYEEEKEYRKQKHELQISQMRQPQFDQLMQYKSADCKQNASSTGDCNMQKPEAVHPETVDRIPPIWQNHKETLLKIKPNAELFCQWSADQLQQSGELIAFLEQQPNHFPHWLQQIKDCLTYEFKLRLMTMPSAV